MRRASGDRRLAAFAAPRVVALLAALVIGFGACTSAPPYEQRVHVVRSGETLFSIAWANGVDQRDLARWNGIKNPNLIQVVQRLRLSPPGASAATQASGAKSAAPPRAAGASGSTRGASPDGGAAGDSSSKSGAAKPAAEPPLPNLPPPQWAWPTDGQVVTRFGSHEGIATGVGIGGRAGDAVRAAAAGRHGCGW